MSASDDAYPPQYVEAIRLFNEEEFFECHDVLEELWSETLGEERRFYQGLIQVAVALFHFGNENLGGARKLYDSATKNLAGYQGIYEGLDVDRLRTDLAHCFEELLGSHENYPADVRVQDDRIPRLVLVDPE